MSEPGTLLLAEPSTARQIARRLGDDAPLLSCQDPYDAIVHMGRRAWQCIVLSAPQVQFEGLCRASRRLGRHARLVALCPPHAEPALLSLAGDLIDDYIISPPTADEWRRVVGVTPPPQSQPASARAVESPAANAPTGVSAAAPSAGLSEGLGAEDFAQLVLATQSLSALEARVVELVKQRLGIDARWQDLESVRPGAGALVMLGQNVRLALVGDRAPQANAQAVLHSLGQCLPALAAAARRNESLHRLAITDELTGAYNRRYFLHLTDQVLVRAAVSGHRVSLLLYDIDDFKSYNDRYGHGAGDEILRETASLIKKTVRSHDIVARIGGDEFAVLFWDAHGPRSPDSRPPDSAFVLAERFRRAVTGHHFPSLGPHAAGSLTISGGLARFDRDCASAEELLAKADEALIAVKQSGKNAIRLVGQT